MLYRPTIYTDRERLDMFVLSDHVIHYYLYARGIPQTRQLDRFAAAD